jgi:hypothetical protein
MPSAQFFIDLHRYINSGMRLFYYDDLWIQPSAHFYMDLQKNGDGYTEYLMTEIRRQWKLASHEVREFLLMEIDVVRFMAEDDEPLNVHEFAQYWRSLDGTNRQYYRSHFPRY